MGYYIPGPVQGKAKYIKEVHNGEIIECPSSFSDIPSGKALICVVDNGPFEASGYAFSEREFEVFNRSDGRQKIWMVMDEDLARELSGYDLPPSGSRR